VGRNFAAGMTGGVAYVLDMKETFERNSNRELAKLERVTSESDEQMLRRLIERHSELTGSLRAREVLWNWSRFKPRFWQVVTQGAMAVRADQQTYRRASREAATIDSNESIPISPPRRISASK